MAYTTEDFFREISPNEHVFLIGNGINYYNARNTPRNTHSWENLLKTIIKRSLGSSHILHKLVGKPGISNTEIQNLLIMEGKKKYQDNQKEVTLNRMICETIERSERVARPNPLLDFANRNNMPILTTNFDFSIEKYLWHENYKEYKTDSLLRASKMYRWNCYYGKDPSKIPMHSCNVWHVHGSRDYQQSLIFSATTYMSISQHASLIMNTCYHNSDNWRGRNTWLDMILNRPLIIVGLGLDPQETFLRWLLIARKNSKGLWQNSRSDMPKSFYLERKVPPKKAKPGKQPNQCDEPAGKEEFLCFLGIETVYLDDNELYAHPSWQL